MIDDRPTPRQQLLAALAIGALALAGSIGAMQAGRARCSPATDPAGRGIAPIAPIGPPTAAAEATDPRGP